MQEVAVTQHSSIGFEGIKNDLNSGRLPMMPMIPSSLREG